MKEKILNIYIVIVNNEISAFKAKDYDAGGDDSDKIKFLKENAKKDYTSAEEFPAPTNSKGKFMSYNQFEKLERQGMHYRLFEQIFDKYDVPQNPLICVTPILDGRILSD